MDNRIEINPKVHHGRPVERSLGELAEGAEVKDVCQQYDLTPEDVGTVIKDILS